MNITISQHLPKNTVNVFLTVEIYVVKKHRVHCVGYICYFCKDNKMHSLKMILVELFFVRHAYKQIDVK